MILECRAGIPRRQELSAGVCLEKHAAYSKRVNRSGVYKSSLPCILCWILSPVIYTLSYKEKWQAAAQLSSSRPASGLPSSQKLSSRARDVYSSHGTHPHSPISNQHIYIPIPIPPRITQELPHYPSNSALSSAYDLRTKTP